MSLQCGEKAHATGDDVGRRAASLPAPERLRPLWAGMNVAPSATGEKARGEGECFGWANLSEAWMVAVRTPSNPSPPRVCGKNDVRTGQRTDI